MILTLWLLVIAVTYLFWLTGHTYWQLHVTRQALAIVITGLREAGMLDYADETL